MYPGCAWARCKMAVVVLIKDESRHINGKASWGLENPAASASQVLGKP